MRGARVLLLFLAALWSRGAAAQGGEDPRMEFLDRWCVDCHGGAAPAGGLDLRVFGGGFQAGEDLGAWLSMTRRVASGEMPPPPRVRPPAGEADAWLREVDAGLDAALAGRSFRPGRTGLRRLSRFEYGRSIESVFGVEAPLHDLPADDLVHGFDNGGGTSVFSPMHVERYLAVAEAVAARAWTGEEPGKIPVRSFEAEFMERSQDDRAGGDVASLYRNGSVSEAVSFPRDGTYRLSVHAYATQAGGEPARMVLSIDGRPAGEFEVRASRTGPGVYTKESAIRQGVRRIALAFVNDYYDPKHPDPKLRDRNLFIDKLVVEGPLEPVVLTPFQREMLALDPGSGPPAERMRPMVAELLSRVFRRAPGEDEIDAFAVLWSGDCQAGASFREGFQTVIAAALSSPRFLLRNEAGEHRGRRDLAPLGGPALASRLSFFIESGPPDARLRRLGDSGALEDRGVLLEEARRLLAGERSNALSTNFAAQWLDLRTLHQIAPDPARFPAWSQELRDDLLRETTLLFRSVLAEGRPAKDLLLSGETFLNGRLAGHYGIDGVAGDGFVRTKLDGRRPGGLLGHGSVLAVTSNPTRTSPVKRGKWVLDVLLDAAPPPPPPGVDSLEDDAGPLDSLSLREQMEIHRARRDCAICHQRMDSLGFALENYDPLGRFRSADRGRPVDASGTLPDGRELRSAEGLASYAAQGRDFLRSLAKRLFIYGIGRYPEGDDLLAVEALVRSLDPDRATLEELVLGIAGLEAFVSSGQ